MQDIRREYPDKLVQLAREIEGAPGPFGVASHADDVAGAMDSAGIDRAIVVGHSMGACVAGALCRASRPG
jgi:pimeloyl-ACP methyl ester carboxylesterase